VELLLVVEITKFIHLQQMVVFQFHAGNPAGSDTVDYLVVAGGGGGGLVVAGRWWWSRRFRESSTGLVLHSIHL
jgi:hypothetical protein